MGTQFFLSCYNPVGEVMDLLALGNSAANFLLYCLMSTQFRATISKMLGLRARPQPARVELTVRTKLEVNWQQVFLMLGGTSMSQTQLLNFTVTE